MRRRFLPPAARAAADALRFFTRLPLPEEGTPGSLEMNRLAWAAPLAGAAVGLAGAAALALAHVLGLPRVLEAALAIAALVAATGALHEDGLADVADGFGAGQERERKLAIMRDPRIGAYGAAALALALILRVGALSSALALGFWPAAGALVIVSAVSRAGALAPLALLDPARADGAGAAAGRLEAKAFAAASASAIAIALALGFALGRPAGAAAALVAAALAASAVAALAKRQIGGQTGDVAGAAQQAGEIAAWCGLLIGADGA